MLDSDRRELRRGSELIPVQPQVFDLLLHLLQNRERVISRDELVEIIWHGRVVSEASIDARISAARHAVGDSGATQQLIRTFRRKGIRFVGPAEQDEPIPGPQSTALALPNRPSIAVLPFANFSGSVEQDYFTDGITEEIITALAKWRSCCYSRQPGLRAIRPRA